MTITRTLLIIKGTLTKKQRILCIIRIVKHNYILPISTVRIQLHVSALYVEHFQVEIFKLQISYTRCVGHLFGQGGRYLVSIVYNTTPSFRSDFPIILFMYNNAKSML